MNQKTLASPGILELDNIFVHSIDTGFLWRLGARGVDTQVIPPVRDLDQLSY